MVYLTPHCVQLDGEIQGARSVFGQNINFLKEKVEKHIKMQRCWSVVRDAELKFCQNGAMLVRIISEVMERH